MEGCGIVRLRLIAKVITENDQGIPRTQGVQYINVSESIFIESIIVVKCCTLINLLAFVVGVEVRFVIHHFHFNVFLYFFRLLLRDDQI